MDVRAYLKDYLVGYKHYKPYWNYEDGCVLLGCIDLYEATGDLLYRDFVLAYLREAVSPAGEIPTTSSANTISTASIAARHCFSHGRRRG